MKQNKVEIGLILDCSGSMTKLKYDIIGSFNDFIRKQKQLKGECNIWLTFFSDSYYMKHKSVPLDTISDLTDESYITNGMTALNDAVFATMTEMGKHFASMDESERPEKVIIVIMTDGEENSSKEISHEQVKNLIKQQKEVYSWDFLYIGTDDLNVNDIAKSYNIDPSHTISYARSSQGAQSAYTTMCSYVSQFRGN